MLQRYLHFVQCIHKTHSQHVEKMQDNIRIVLTLSILKTKKNKNIVITDWIRNKINKVHNAYLCFIEFKEANWSEKKTSLLCFFIVCQYVISTGTISNTSIHQPQSVTAKLLIIQGHIKLRHDVLYKCVIDECTNLMPFKQ